MVGDIIVFAASSKMKFQPITTINKAAYIFGKLPITPGEVRKSLKKIIAPKANIPVFVTGTEIEAIIVPTVGNFFLNKRYR